MPCTMGTLDTADMSMWKSSLPAEEHIIKLYRAGAVGSGCTLRCICWEGAVV